LAISPQLLEIPQTNTQQEKPLTRKQVLKNAKKLQNQIGKILDLKKTNVRFLYNAKWTNKLRADDLLEIFSRLP